MARPVIFLKHSAIIAAFAVLSGCGGEKVQEANLHDLMTNQFKPQAQLLWDGVNKAIDDEGNLDASRLNDADWTRMEAAATKLQAAAKQIEEARRVTVAAQGVRIAYDDMPGAWGANQVQHAIDGAPDDLKQHARKIDDTVSKFMTGIHARSMAGFSNLAAELDDDCEACHRQFWYPNQ